MAYSDQVIDHDNHPGDAGSLPKNDPNVGTGLVGAPECGDVMKLQMKINSETQVIEEAEFNTFGCGSAIASSSLPTECVKGKTSRKRWPSRTMMRRLVISLVMILLSTPLIYGQDLSKYRNFSFGMSLADLSKQVSSQRVHAKLIQKRPAVIQEVTWWPRESSSSSPSTLQAEPVWQVLFTFHNGELYRILATYDRHATEGLGIEDMVEAISAEYGPATRPDVQISFPTNELYSSTEKVIARWEDSQYSFNLFRSSFLNTFGLVMFSKRLDGQAKAAIAESVKLEGQEDLQKEIERQKKEADNLEVSRQKNRKAFRP